MVWQGRNFSGFCLDKTSLCTRIGYVTSQITYLFQYCERFKMLEDFDKKETQRNHRKKKQNKSYHDDDQYGKNKLRKEFKKKKQMMKEEDDIEDWSDFIK
jgi:hypothetical protein